MFRRNIHKVVYVVRDPRDIAPSLARHLSMNVDRTIEVMADERYRLSEYPKRIGSQIAQYLSTWSAHVESWTQSGLPVHVVRYEDMVAAPARVFAQSWSSWSACARRSLSGGPVGNHLRHTPGEGGGERLSGEAGGPHRSSTAARWVGWRAALSLEQTKRIENFHGAVMRRLGYLD